MKKNSCLVFFLFFNNLNIVQVNAQLHWAQKTDFPSGRSGVTPFSIGTKGYFSCGVDNSFISYNDLWEYDPVTDVWTQKAGLGGGPRYSASGFSIGNLGYVCLGWDVSGNGMNDLWEYDPALNTWTSKTNFPGSQRYNAVAMVVANKAYVGLGYKPVKDDIYEYDPVTDTWTILANSFPGGARTNAAAFSCTYTISGTNYENGYICTGSFDPDANTLLANDLWEFTPGVSAGSGTWVAKSNFPGSNRFAAFTFAFNGKGYVGGGLGVGLIQFNDFYEYDPVTDTWAVRDTFPGINCVHARGFAVNNKGYAGTGQDLTTYYPFFYEYAPAIVPAIQLASSDTSFCDKHCIDFFDLSTNNPTSWQWFFPGAGSTTSTLQNPANICYNNYGSFDVTLIACNAAGCDTLILPAFINEYPLPVATITQSNDTLFASPGVTYQWWSVDSGIIPGETGNYFIPMQSGDYFVVVTDSVGCQSSSNVIAITGIYSPPQTGDGFIIKPNPNNGCFTLSFSSNESKDFTIRIINHIGKTVYSVNGLKSAAGNNIFTMDARIGKVAAGLYAVEIIDGAKTLTGRFILE